MAKQKDDAQGDPSANICRWCGAVKKIRRFLLGDNSPQPTRRGEAGAYCPKCDRATCPKCGDSLLDGLEVICPSCGVTVSAHDPATKGAP